MATNGKDGPQLLRVKDWNEHFECSQSRNLKKMAWVPIRVNLAGDGYTELLNHPNGPAHFGGWIGLVEVAALCEPRGTLVRGNGKPHDPESLSRITRIPEAVLTEAIPRLLNIGWLEWDAVTRQQDTVGILEDAVACQRKFVATDRQDITDKTDITPMSDLHRTDQGDFDLTSSEIKPIYDKGWFDKAHDLWYKTAYWRKVGRGKSRIAYEKRLRALVASGMGYEDAAAFLVKAATDDQKRFESTDDWVWRQKLLPATWLNQERWNDEPPAPVKTKLDAIVEMAVANRRSK